MDTQIRAVNQDIAVVCVEEESVRGFPIVDEKETVVESQPDFVSETDLPQGPITFGDPSLFDEKSNIGFACQGYVEEFENQCPKPYVLNDEGLYVHRLSPQFYADPERLVVNNILSDEELPAYCEKLEKRQTKEHHEFADHVPYQKTSSGLYVWKSSPHVIVEPAYLVKQGVLSQGETLNYYSKVREMLAIQRDGFRVQTEYTSKGLLRYVYDKVLVPPTEVARKFVKRWTPDMLRSYRDSWDLNVNVREAVKERIFTPVFEASKDRFYKTTDFAERILTEVRKLGAATVAFLEEHEEFVDTLIESLMLVDLACTLKTSPRHLSEIVYIALGRAKISFINKAAQAAAVGVLCAGMQKINEIARPESYGDFVDTYQDMATFFKSVINSDLLRTIRRFVFGLLTLKFFSANYAEQLEKFVAKDNKLEGTVFGVVVDAMEIIGQLLRFGECIMGGVPNISLYMEADPVAAWTVLCKKWFANGESLYSGIRPNRDETVKWTERRQYVVEGTDLVLHGTKLSKQFNYGDKRKITVEEMLLAVNKKLDEVKKTIMSEGRVVPYGVLIPGPPGIGKSSFLDEVARVHAFVMGREHRPEFVYTRTVASPYWEGYEPFSQTVVHFPEVGNETRERAQRGDSTAIAELLNVLDSKRYMVDMAFSGKGKTPCLAELVMMDSNNETLNLEYLFQNPAAFRRRYVTIKALPKAEFRKVVDGKPTTALDPEKAMNHPTGDLWDIEMYREIPDGMRNTVKYDLFSALDQKEKELDTITQFRIALSRDIVSHFERERKYARKLARQTDIENYALCDRAQPEADFTPWEAAAGAVFKDEGLEYPTEKYSPITAFGVRMLHGNFASLCYAFGVAVQNMYIRVTAFVYYLVLYTVFSYLLSANIPVSDMPSLHSFSTYVCMFLLTAMFARYSFVVALIFAVMFCCKWHIVVAKHAVLQNRAYTRKSIEVMQKAHFERANALFWNRDFPCVIATSFAIGAGAVVLLELTKFLMKLWDGAHSASPQASIEDFELRHECSSSYEKVKVKSNPTAWNLRVVEHMVKHTGTAETLSKSVRANVRPVRILRPDGSACNQFLFGLRANIALVNLHSLPASGEFTLQVGKSGVKPGVDVADSRIHRDNVIPVGVDIGIVRLSGVSFKDIVQHIIVSNENLDTFSGYLGDTKVVAHVIPQVRSMAKRVTGETVDYTLKDVVSYKLPGHQTGLCGMPLIAQVNNGAVIVGIHSCGSVTDDLAYSERFDMKTIVEGLAIVVPESLCELATVTVDLKLEEPIEQSPFRHERLADVEYFGKIPGPVMPRGKSRLVKSLFADHLDVMFLEHCNWQRHTVFVPPLMRPVGKGSDYKSPWNVGLRKFATHTPALDRKILRRCVDYYLSKAVEPLVKHVGKVRPLLASVAINGVVHDPYLKAVNASTSAGFGRSGKKANYLPRTEEGSRIMTEDLESDVADMIAACEIGVISAPVFSMKLKDEPRDLAKVEKAKTRLFSATPLDFYIVCKMFLGPLFAIMQEEADSFWCELGVDAMKEMGAKFTEMIAFSPFIFEGDYSGYDTAKPFDISWAMVDFFMKFAKMVGYSEMNLRVLRTILTIFTSPCYEICTDVFRKPGSEPSGGYGTLERNTVYNNLFKLYYWFSHPKLRDLDFITYVKPKAFGDDDLTSVKPEIREYLDGAQYAAFVEQHYGMKFTCSDKDGPAEKWIPPHRMTFLKRFYRTHPESGKHCAPLHLDSIYKMLEWILPSPNMSYESQHLDILRSATRELFFWLPRREYTRMTHELVMIMSNHTSMPAGDIYSKLPKYENLMFEFFGVVTEPLEFKVANPYYEAYPESSHEGAVSRDTLGTVQDEYTTEDVKEIVHDGEYTLTYPVTDVAGFLARPVLLRSGTILIGTYADNTTDVWTLLTLDTTVRAKLRNFAVMRATLHMRVVTSGSPFHYGRAIVAYVPFSQENVSYIAASSAGTEWRARYLTNSPFAKSIGFTGSSTVEIKVPWIHPKPFGRLYNLNGQAVGQEETFKDFRELGVLTVAGLTPVDVAQTNATPVSYEIYAWLEDVSMGVPTGTIVNARPESAEEVRGPVETVLTAGAAVAQVMGIPSTTLTSLAKGAAAMGWSAPTSEQYVEKRRIAPLANLAHGIRLDQGDKITLDPKQTLTVSPSMVGLHVDEMSVAFLAKREGWLYTGTWDEKDPTDTQLMIACVTPTARSYEQVSFSIYSQMSSLAGVSRLFGYWTGSITYRIEIVASVYHRGKLLLVYEPNGWQAALQAPTFRLNQRFSKVIDIEKTRNLEFTVKWGMEKPWLPTTSTDPALNPELVVGNPATIDVSTAMPYSNGVIWLQPFTTLQSPLSTAPVYYNVYVRSDDVMFERPLDTKVRVYLPGSPRVARPESHLVEASEVEVTVLNETGAVASACMTAYFGEGYPSLRTLLKRYELSTTETTSPPSLPVDRVLLRRLIFPTFVYDPDGVYDGEYTLLNYLRLMYCFMRGGMKKLIRVRKATVAPADEVYVSARLSHVGVTTPTFSLLPGLIRPSFEGVSLMMPRLSGSMEYEIPFYSHDLFVPAQKEAYRDLYERGTACYEFEWESGSIGSNMKFVEWSATGEDFQLLLYMGPPIEIITG